uniref:Secreted protein n=1 Tax=Pyxicephalus adspersus TaxID=30357 RepID=A0AAV3AB14_PYXAD|nr:TPA: hypothetical protein GDO54_014935 [Pyxicephalus adspersus]
MLVWSALVQADPGLTFPAGLRKMCAFPEHVAIRPFPWVSSLFLFIYTSSVDFCVSSVFSSHAISAPFIWLLPTDAEFTAVWRPSAETTPWGVRSSRQQPPPAGINQYLWRHLPDDSSFQPSPFTLSAIFLNSHPFAFRKKTFSAVSQSISPPLTSCTLSVKSFYYFLFYFLVDTATEVC